MLDKIKENKKLILHLVIIVLGIIFVAIPIFHTNVWFDEAYSIGMSNHSFVEIWTIGGHDVHPVLFYWILHIINLIFGNQIILYRVFTLLCASILGILGYTHIRKDFGENTGILFSFFAYFLPTTMVYAGEIRMYSMTMLFATIMSIYAYRIYKNKEEKQIKNWIIFAIFSLASAYSHYYGLVVAGIINIILFVIFVLQSKKAKELTYNLKSFLVSGVSQVVLYLPWIVYLLLQISQVSQGFWIGIKFPDTLIEFFTFQFTGNLGGTQYISNLWAGIYGMLIIAYMIYIYVKNKKDKELKPGSLAIQIWGAVAILVCIISLIIWRPIIYARYMLCVSGLFIFFFANTMAKRGNNKINIAICAITVIISIFVSINLVQDNYDSSNKEIQNYLEENVQSNDIFLHGNRGSGFVVCANYPDNKEYFLNEDNWNVEEAYEAFGNDFETIWDLDVLEDYTGRIWIINENHDLYEEMNEKYDLELIEQKHFKIKYKNTEFAINLVEKK